jgi:hypothetical protein
MREMIWFVLLSAATLQLAFCSRKEAEARPPQAWTEKEIVTSLARAGGFQPVPGYGEREEWGRLRTDPRLAEGFAVVMRRAEEFSARPLPALSFSQFLEARRSGDHRAYERVLNQRADYLGTLALGECLTGDGRFLAALADAIWSFCEESDWCLPPNSRAVIDMDNPPIDLRSATVGFELAMIHSVFGEALDAGLRARIRYELERRLFKPYVQRVDFPWFNARNNLNAVCNGSVLRAALLALEDKVRLAQITAKALDSLSFFLDGFGADGGTAEGIGYWEYGFARHYLAAAQLLRLHTQGRLDLLSTPVIREIALLPLRMELSPGRYANFSDSMEQQRISPSVWFFLARSLQISELQDFAEARSQERVWIGNLESLFQFLQGLPSGGGSTFQHASHYYLPETQWLVARAEPANPRGLVLAARGGSNNEPHNHNDVGSFVVHYRGESLVAELGPPQYERDYFSSKRYDYLAARSLGHSVPLINGLEQVAGAGTEAESRFEHGPGRDRLVIGMKNAYPAETGLESLTRTVTLHRQGAGWLEVQDEAQFSSIPGSFEGALITFAEISRPAPGHIALLGRTGSLTVIYDPKLLEVVIAEYDTALEKLRVSAEHPVARRLAFQVRAPSARIRLHLKIVPGDSTPPV